MLTRFLTTRVRRVAGGLLAAFLLAPAAAAQAQNAVITGKVVGDAGQPLEFANVYISELVISVATNAQGVYTVTVPAARVQGQAVNLRVRAVGFTPAFVPIKVTAGNQTHNFSLKRDINRLSEVVVTGSIEGTERAKVPFAVGRLTAEDIPVPQLDPLRALQGKVAGMRVAQTGGRPGSQPEILMRGPTSINASGRSQGPMIIVDGTILRTGALNEIGGLDIESVEVVKGAAGATLYGSTAANGVIIIKTKRGASRDEVRFNARTEYGISDLQSLRYGAPENTILQLDETGQKFCVQGGGNVASCSRSTRFMDEILRINNVAADTTRTPQAIQWFSPALGNGSALNVYQANRWPGQRYNTFAQISTPNALMLNSVDITGRAGSVRYFVSGQQTTDQGAIRDLDGVQDRRARVNIDYDVRPGLTVSISTLFNKSVNDLRGSGFGALLRGAPAGTDYLARDTLGRALVRGGGSGFSPTGNGGAGLLYPVTDDMEISTQNSTRYLASVGANWNPTEWASFEALYSYDNRSRYNLGYVQKGYRTFSQSNATNRGNMSLSDLYTSSQNGNVSATFRKQLSPDLSAKVNLRAWFDNSSSLSNSGSGQEFVVKDIYTLSNTSVNFSAGSSQQTIKNLAYIGSANLDYKGKYILDGAYRYDGSSLFGAGNRWAPFYRASAVWRLSEESWFSLPQVSDLRLRSSLGTAGNTPSFTAQYETYSCSASGCALGQAGNSGLKPETTTEIEVGSDFTLFNRLGVEFTWIRSDTRNQILNVPTPSALGFSSQWRNAGTLQNKTFELALNLPVITTQDLQWSMRGTWDRTRTFVSELFMPEYFTNAGTGQGTGSMFLISARRDQNNGYPVNRYGNIWGRKFYTSCATLPQSVQGQCGPGRAFQVNDDGYVVWTGEGNSWQEGITKNLWQTKLPAAQSPWNYPLYFGHPIIDRPLKGEVGEGVGTNQILGNTLPSFRIGFNNTVTYKKFTLFGLVDGVFGHRIQNQGEGWGLLDIASGFFDMGNRTVQSAKPVGYGWRVGGAEGAGSGGFYDLLGPNNYNTELGSYAKLREVSLSYKLGKVGGFGDWSVAAIGRNLWVWTGYTGYDPEVGVSGGQAGSGLINQVDAFDFPTLRQFSFSLSTRF